MELPEAASTQRHYDYELGQIRSRVDSLEPILASISQDIKDIRQAPPRYPIVVGGILALGFVFTVVGLLVTPIGKSLSITHADLAKHERLDGHSVMIKALQLIDKMHTEEHLEQEEDIGELRENYRGLERRHDGVVERIGRLESLSAEREDRIISSIGDLKERIDAKAEDRWTGEMQKVYQRAIEQRIKEVERTIR